MGMKKNPTNIYILCTDTEASNYTSTLAKKSLSADFCTKRSAQDSRGENCNLLLEKKFIDIGS